MGTQFRRLSRTFCAEEVGACDHPRLLWDARLKSGAPMESPIPILQRDWRHSSSIGIPFAYFAYIEAELGLEIQRLPKRRRVR